MTKKADRVTEDDTEATKSARMKASVVTEIACVISASLTSTAKPDTTGLERRVRWRGLGILAGDDIEADAATTTANASAPMRTARHICTGLETNLPFSLVNAGIHFHPLKHDSWVLVGFQDKVWLGNVKLIYVKGGGQKPTHNYVESCNSINNLSVAFRGADLPALWAIIDATYLQTGRLLS